MELIQTLFAKFVNYETISYLIVGVLTTVISIGTFALCYRRLRHVTSYKPRIFYDVALPLLCTLAGGVAAIPVAGLNLHRTFKAALICTVCVGVYLGLYKLVRRAKPCKAF